MAIIVMDGRDMIEASRRIWNWMKGFLAAVVVGLVAGTVYFMVGRSGPGSDAKVEEESRVRTATVTRQDIRFDINLAGEITPLEVVSVRPEVNGRISQLPVDISDKVSKGDLLFSLDDRDLMIELESRRTEIEAAQLQLDQAHRLYLRQKDLFEEDLVSREEFENSLTDYELAQNRIERARKELDMSEDRLSRTRILAPFDGTILTRSVSLGQAVSGSGGFNSGTEVMTIADLGRMIINAHVNQVDVTRLKNGMEVSIEVEAVNGLRIPGRIDRIAPQATMKSRTKGYETRILLTDSDPRIQPGMTANIIIPIAASDDVVAVPLAAVFTEFNNQTKAMDRYVYVQKDGQFELRQVVTGIADYNFVEVLEGLEEGEVISLEKPEPEQIRVNASSDTKGGAS